MTPEELTAKLKAAETERDEALGKLKTLEEDALVREEGAKLAQQGIEAAHEVAAQHNERVAEEARKAVIAALPYGVATALDKVIVTPQVVVPGGIRRYGNLTKAQRQFMDQVLGRKTAMTSTGNGSGDQWVPTDMDNEMFRMVDLASRVRGFIRVVDMPSNPYTLPGVSAHLALEYRGENTTPTANNPTTASVTLTAFKLIGKVQFSEELVEDSIVPVVDMLMEDCSTAAAQAEEDVLLWGDDTTTAASNIDKGITSNHVRLAANGLYKQVKDAGSAVFIAYGTDWPTSMRAQRAAMGKYGVRPDDLLYIMSAAVFNHSITNSGFLTWDKVGANAAALTGVLPNASAAQPYGLFDGGWVTVSASMYDTDTTGVVTATAASNVKHTEMVINRRRVVLGQRRRIVVKPYLDPLTDSQYLVVTTRIAIGLLDAATSGAYTAGYNG